MAFTVKQGADDLAASNYTYVSGIFSLTAAYTDTLAVGEYTFTVTTTEGSVTFTVTVAQAVVTPPEGGEGGGSQGSNAGSGNVWDPNFDWDNWDGDVKPNLNGNYAQGYKGDGCGGSVGALSGLALIGVAAVALALKKKRD